MDTDHMNGAQALFNALTGARLDTCVGTITNQ